jgi:hypothetical protein
MSKPVYDEYDPWATYNPDGPVVVRRTPKRNRIRKPTLANVAKQAVKAGIDAARYEVGVDGTIVVVTGKPINSTETGTNPDADEWN